MVDKERDGPLISMDVKDFILTVGARSPTPGGGCVAALTATLVSIHLLHNIVVDISDITAMIQTHVRLTV
jgi:formiminotetrahydrofolate cyclodeaminase